MAERLHNMGKIVRGRNQINIVTPLFLQRKHFLRQRFRRNCFSDPFLADLVVLAETAAEMAVREKNRSRAPRAGQCRLFPKVSQRFGNAQLSRSPASAQLSLYAVHAALPGAERAAG